MIDQSSSRNEEPPLALSNLLSAGTIISIVAAIIFIVVVVVVVVAVAAVAVAAVAVAVRLGAENSSSNAAPIFPTPITTTLQLASPILVAVRAG